MNKYLNLRQFVEAGVSNDIRGPGISPQIFPERVDTHQLGCTSNDRSRILEKNNWK